MIFSPTHPKGKQKNDVSFTFGPGPGGSVVWNNELDRLLWLFALRFGGFEDRNAGRVVFQEGEKH